jgi:hypothetical protein
VCDSVWYRYHVESCRRILLRKEGLLATGYDSGTLGHQRKLIGTRECEGDVDCVITALQELKKQVKPGNTVYVALGSTSWEAEVVAKLSLVEDTLEDGRVIYAIVLDM